MSDLFDLPFEEDEDEQSPVSGLQSPVPTPVSARRVLSVTELTVRVRDLLESEFIEVWVEGEISKSRVWNNGHM